MRAPKKEKRREEKTVFLLLGPEGVALRQRPDTGLLAGLWEYPHVNGRLRGGNLGWFSKKRIANDQF